MSYALPFKRGHLWISSEQGAVPSGILGKTYLDSKNGQIIQIAKNTDASAISGCDLLKWENAAGSRYEVDRAAASGLMTLAGVADPTYANKGVTVPVNAAFIMVKQGLVHCLAGSITTAGSALGSESGATKGRVQTLAAGANPGQVYGTILASANAATSVLCAVRFP